MLRAAGGGRKIFKVPIEKLSFANTVAQIALVFVINLCDMTREPPPLFLYIFTRLLIYKSGALDLILKLSGNLKRHLAFKLTTTFHSQILLAFQQKSAWKTVKLSLLRSTGTRRNK